jgi:hypothetical protein
MLKDIPSHGVICARKASMIDLANLEVWFIPGSQELYGPEALKQVEEHSLAIAGALSASPHIPARIPSRTFTAWHNFQESRYSV